MRIFFTYLCLEIKRLFKSIPYMLMGVIVLAFFASAITFSMSKFIYSNQNSGIIKVAVNIPESDLLTRKAMNMVSSTDSINSICDFVYVDEKTGIEGVKNGRFFAFMNFSHGIVEGIMNGSNIPVTIIFEQGKPVESLIFIELASAGEKLLSASQSGIYSVDSYLLSINRGDLIPQAEKELNEIFLKYALNREALFKKDFYNFNGGNSIELHFLISLWVSIIFLSLISLSAFMRSDSDMLVLQLNKRGLNLWKRLFVKFVCLSIFFLILNLIPYLFFVITGYSKICAGDILILLSIIFSLSSYSLMIYTLFKDRFTSTVICFLSSIFILFLSGCIIPIVFFPQKVQLLGECLLPFFITKALKEMLFYSNSSVLKILIINTIFYFLVSIYAEYKRDY